MPLYGAVADACRSRGHNVFLPHDIKGSHESPAEVFDRDFFALSAADILIAFVGLPSSGVGAELGIAFMLQKRIIALWHLEQAPSRFLLGLLGFAGASQIQYDTIETCASAVGQLLSAQES